MGRWRVTYTFLGTILILSLLIQGTCAAEGINETNRSKAGANVNTESSSWIILLPVFFGCLLFLGWVCRYFEETTTTFILLMVFLMGNTSLFLILRSGLFSNFITSEQITNMLVYSGLGAIISTALIHYLYIKKDKKNERCFLAKLRSVNIIGTVLIWPIILIYYYVTSTEFVVFNGNTDLAFPVFIITASYIGIISYLLLSIEEAFSHLVPEYERLSIVWSYLRRIFIAPYIAIIGYYLLTHFISLPDNVDINSALIFIFSFFVGIFTKTIEEWIYDWVQKLLPESKRDELRMRDKYDVENSDFVKILRLDEDVAYRLYHANIRTIDDLASFNSKELKKKLNQNDQDDSDDKCVSRSRCYSDKQVSMYIKKAEKFIGMDKSELIIKLKMENELALKLQKCVGINTIADLSTRNKMYILQRLGECNESAAENEISKYIDRALKYMSIDKSELVTELKIDKNIARKLSYIGIDNIKNLSESNVTDINQRLLEEINETVPESEVQKYIDRALKYLSIDMSELITELKLDRKHALIFSYIGIDSIEKLSKSNAKDINRKLSDEINESLPESIINGYIDKAKKHIEAHPNLE